MDTSQAQLESRHESRAPVDPADEAYQDHALIGVSRTFALTIPQLPDDLRRVVTNGYLLCRIADTIEDEPALSWDQKQHFHELFCAVVAGRASARPFAEELHPLLSTSTLPAERELIENTPRVIRVTHAFRAAQRDALERCVRIMGEGMPRFQKGGKRRGLRDVEELHDYCYYVAGVVGEMLTQLFCEHSPEIAARREGLERFAVSFGQGLQMTNILKDIWDDLARGFCWLPVEVFQRQGFDLDRLTPGEYSPAFGRALDELIAIAHEHLQDALQYVLLIPPREGGIRRFCLWALGMAVLTLRKIHRHKEFSASREVKITRRSVKATIVASNLTARSDRSLRLLFTLCSVGLPKRARMG